MTPILRSALALALTLACGSAWADVTVRNAAGTTVTQRGYVTPDGKNVISNEQFNTPATRLNSSGTITTANTAQQAVAANTFRRSGYCQSDPRNSDTLELAFGVSASTTAGGANDCILTPGGVCPFTLAGGVFQGSISAASATVGTAYNCTEFQ
jgi:hypothetical protein